MMSLLANDDRLTSHEDREEDVIVNLSQMNIIAGGFYDGLMLYAHALNETMLVSDGRPPGKVVNKRMWNRTFNGQCMMLMSDFRLQSNCTFPSDSSRIGPVKFVQMRQLSQLSVLLTDRSSDPNADTVGRVWRGFKLCLMKWGVAALLSRVQTKLDVPKLAC